jgi:hypothetical protein
MRIFAVMTTNELFDRCKELALAEPSPTALRLMHETLVLACAEALKNSATGFGNLFAQVDYLAKRSGMSTADRMAVQQMRRRSNRSQTGSRQQWLYDVRALTLFVAAVFATAVPDGVTQLIPHSPAPMDTEALPVNSRYLRCIVNRYDALTIDAETADGQHIVVDYSEHGYLCKMLRQGMQLNLLDSHVEGATVTPRLVVVEPDFLVDISAIARCFQGSYGHHPLTYTIERLRPRGNSQAMLLGNFAGAALDDIINQDDYRLSHTLNSFFSRQALQFATCQGFNAPQFLDEARQQSENIRQAVAALFDDAYEVEFELSKKATMISEQNPVTATAKKGDVGTIKYEGDDTKCKVTIPMTYGETTVEYVLNIVQKPDFKLTYIDTDKSTVLGEFIREKDEKIGAFDIDYATATAQEGTKVRGWFLKTAGGEKYTAETVVTGDISLYAVATEIETASKSDKYNFDLTDKLFDAADHEAFTPTGEGFYWHDAQHGWAFKTGNKIDLLVGPKATVSVTLCRYGAAEDITITDASGKEIGKIAGKNNDNVDGEIVAFNYEGEGGVITLNLNTSGEMYIHGVKIVNTAEAKFEQQGSWYFVKPGDAKSLIEVLEIVNGANASKDAERSFIYVPDGIYDLNETVKTAISGHNISIIGQSMDKTIIKTAPDKSIEGLGSADMFSASGTNLYMQDITLQNALDYYGALGGGQVGGRAAVIQDRGDRTIFKNVRMLSYQDTYYSSNDAMQSYFDGCDIHGTVDFICGGGDVRFQNCTISL